MRQLIVAIMTALACSSAANAQDRTAVYSWMYRNCQNLMLSQPGATLAFQLEPACSCYAGLVTSTMTAQDIATLSKGGHLTAAGVERGQSALRYCLNNQIIESTQQMLQRFGSH